MIICNGYFDGLVQLWSFHTILYFTLGLDKGTGYLQNETKIAILTIGKLRKKSISEYTNVTKISSFFPIKKRNIY